MTIFEKTKQIYAAVFFFFFALALAFYLIPNFVVEHSEESISTRFFPYVVTLMIGVFSLLVLGNAFYQKPTQDSLEVQNKSSFVTKEACIFIVALILLNVVFEWLGYLVAVPIFTSVFIYLFGDKNIGMVLFKAISITVVTFVAFHYGFSVYLI